LARNDRDRANFHDSSVPEGDLSAKIRVVTDSTASFESPNVIEDYDIIVLPLEVSLGGQSLRDNVDVEAEDVFLHLRHQNSTLAVQAPPQSLFETTFQELNRSTDQICVLVHSQKFSETFARAQAARAGLLGRCEIVVIDSQTTSLGLGYLVEAIASAASDGADIEDAVRIARNVIPRIYSVYYVDTLDYIQRAGLIGQTQAMLGAMLGIKPMLTIEDGKMIVMEKVRTHSQAIDKMVEFVSEFTHVDRLGIVQNTTRSTDRTRMLQDRLALAFNRVQYPVMLYEPLIASMIGPDGMGMYVLEGAEDNDPDLFD
jgi:DegV family protein with EDD domain